MALYVGNSEKLKITLDNAACLLKLITAPVSASVGLVSSDNSILLDSAGLYLLAKEDE
jgi:hypothetical protein